MVAESKTIIDFGSRSWRAFSFCMPRQRRIIFCAMLLGLPFSIIIIFVWKYSFSHDKCLPASYYWSTENVTYSRSRAHLPRRFWSAASSFSMRNTSTLLASGTFRLITARLFNVHPLQCERSGADWWIPIIVMLWWFHYLGPVDCTCIFYSDVLVNW